MNTNPVDKLGVTFEVIGFVFCDDSKVTLKTKAYSETNVVTLLNESFEAGHTFNHGQNAIYCEYGSPNLNVGAAKVLDRFLTVAEQNICLAINYIHPETDGTFTFDALITGPLGNVLKDRFIEGKQVLLGTRIIEKDGKCRIRSIDVIFSSKRVLDTDLDLTKRILEDYNV